MENWLIFVIWWFLFVLFIFFVLLPILFALLLDSFHTTVMDLGSINDIEEHSVKWSFKEIVGFVIVLRPWVVLEEAERELNRKKLKESINDNFD